MKSFWINLQSLFIVYFYLILDKLGFSNNNAIIFMFHHVSNEPVEASLDCKCSVEHFTKILDYLKNKGIKVVSMNDALASIDDGVLSGYAVITFDDGIDDTFTIAYPLLKLYNFPFTVYITLNYLNKQGYLTSEQLEILNEDPLCTLGSHTLNHTLLRTDLNANDEIVNSKQKLENILRKEVIHFAYPFGAIIAVSNKNIIETKTAGYKSAVSSVDARLNFLSTINRFYLPRINGSNFNSF